MAKTDVFIARMLNSAGAKKEELPAWAAARKHDHFGLGKRQGARGRDRHCRILTGVVLGSLCAEWVKGSLGRREEEATWSNG